ncbi:MAG TPA: alkaline phosphatase family protein, partial [Thermoanaerobaculia bacterium]|nr:alkaline phosphatase family protein [Thermoanaerobaculia bacterium]
MKQESRRLSVALVLLVAAVVSCGRSEKAAAPVATSAPPAVDDADIATRSPSPPGSGPAVIWLGLDGLDWELLDRLASSGTMPNWKRLTEEGWSAQLASSYPLLSPILWTTAATGVPPDVHRVLDFQEVDPATGRKVPISGGSRAVPAVWNLASAAGKRVGVVGWWATHPAEEVNGFFVSDRASPLLFDSPSLAGVAFPPGLEKGVEHVMARDGKASHEDLRKYLDPGDEKAKTLFRVVGATRVTQRIARDLYDRDRPDLLAMYFEGTDEIGHLFAPYAPPKVDCVSADEFSRYGRVVDTYYSAIDRILGQWMRRAGEDGATLLVSSDHGFKWGADRPCGFASGNWATAAFWHRPEGVFAAWGSRVRPSSGRGSAKIVDIAPTVLALLGLRVDRRMTGSALSNAFRDLPASVRADLFSTTSVRRVAARATTDSQSDEYVKKLIALGYLSASDARPLAPSGGDRPGMTEGAWNNLGVYLRDTRREPDAARAAFEKSLALRPDYYSALFNMAVLERIRSRTKAADDWFFKSVAAAGGDPAPAILSWAGEYQKTGRTAAALSLLDRAAQSYPASEDIARALAMELSRARDCRRGLAVLSGFEAATKSVSTLNVLALLQTCLEDRPEVVRLLRRSLELDPNQPEVARSLRVAEGP